MKKIAIAISLIFVTLLGLSFQQNNVAMAQEVTGKTTVLFDDAIGNARGWNPDGNTDTFQIFDLDVDTPRSTILVNTRQDNFVNCAVDYIGFQYFEVECLKVKDTYDGPIDPEHVGGPSDGAILHYTVFNRAFGIESLEQPFSSEEAQLPGGIGVSEQAIAGAENRTQTTGNQTTGNSTIQ